jgi:hypothetical protein
MTLKKFVTEFQTAAIDPIVNNNKKTWTPQWQNQVCTEYAQLKAKYPTLISKCAGEKDMYMNFTSVPQKAKLAEILKTLDPNDPNLFKTYPDLKLPAVNFEIALSKIKTQMRQDPIKKALAGIRDNIAKAPDKKTASALAKNHLQAQNLQFDSDDITNVVNSIRGI